MRDWASNVIGLIGVAVIAAGVGLIFIPAGVIVAGLGAVGLAWRLQR